MNKTSMNRQPQSI